MIPVRSHRYTTWAAGVRATKGMARHNDLGSGQRRRTLVNRCLWCAELRTGGAKPPVYWQLRGRRDYTDADTCTDYCWLLHIESELKGKRAREGGKGGELPLERLRRLHGVLLECPKAEAHDGEEYAGEDEQEDGGSTGEEDSTNAGRVCDDEGTHG